jgi:hypothetical protein
MNKKTNRETLITSNFVQYIHHKWYFQQTQTPSLHNYTKSGCGKLKRILHYAKKKTSKLFG